MLGSKLIFQSVVFISKLTIHVSVEQLNAGQIVELTATPQIKAVNVRTGKCSARCFITASGNLRDSLTTTWLS